MRSGHGINELPGDAYAIRHPAHAPFEHITHAKFAADLFHINRPALVCESRIARDNEEPLDPGKSGNDVFDHAVGEIFLLGIATHVLER